MMRSRKPLAVLTAIATMIGGLAIGATAQADIAAVEPDNPATWTDRTVTLTASDYMQQFYTATFDENVTDLKANLRSFKYVRLAEYQTSKTTGTNNKDEYRLTLHTVADANKIKTAFNAVTLTDNGTDTLGSKFTAQQDITDPLQWLGTQDFSETSAGADGGKLTITSANQYELAAQLETQFKDTAANIQAANIAVDKDKKTLTFTFDNPGLYLIIDDTTSDGKVDIAYTNADGSTGTRTYKKIKPILAGTPIPSEINITNTNDASVKLGRVDSFTIKQMISDEIKTKVYFKKTNAQGNALQDAVFTIKKVSADKTASMSVTDKNSFDTFWNGDNFDSSFGTSTTARSDKDGKFDFEGLSKGTYLIYENQPPTGGYLEDYWGRFILQVDQHDDANNGTAAPTITHTLKDVLKSGLLTDADKDGLVSTDKTNNGTSDASRYTYKNITDTSQLPSTGGMGIAMFGVIAALLAGASVVAYVRSRRIRKTLNR